MKIGFIGAGKMATAIAGGLINAGYRHNDIIMSSPNAASDVVGDYIKTAVNKDVAVAADYIFLSVKPNYAVPCLEEIKPVFEPSKVVISICAGVSISTMQAVLGADAKIIRVMPNTPMLVGAGASGMCASPKVTMEDIEQVKTFLNALGVCYLVQEKQMDAVTGLSGSGPAFVYTFIEALSDAGVRGGLTRDVALGLAAQTVFGSAKMVLETGLHPAVLKEQVTSPGGTTIYGVNALDDKGFRAATIAAVDAARLRAEELGQLAAKKN